ncbi:MAG TPA: M36 family metallopeptidase [Gammaproteobacteria bacterium]|nr:M36 family metallopeptidase [Gammaproteobacteria bacterium]
MNRWLVMGLTAAYAGVSAQAAFAANPTRSGPAPSMAAVKPLLQPHNYDASLAAPRTASSQAGPSPRLSKPESIAGGVHYQRLRPAAILGDHYDKALDKSTFIWADETGAHDLNFGVYRRGAGAPTYAKAYLREYASRLGIKPAMANHAQLVFVHDDGNGPVIVRYQQVVDGYDVMGRQLNVIMDQDLNLVGISGYFASAGKAALKADRPFNGGPQAAMNAAFKDLHLPASAYNLHRTSSHKGGFAHYAPQPGSQRAVAVRLTAPVGAKKVLFPVNGELVPAWLMTVQAGRADSADSIGYAYVASADGSRVLYRKNLIDHAAYTYRVFADPATQKPDDSPFGNDRVPYAGSFPETFGTGSLVDVTATQGITDPWLPIAAAGFPTDKTTGNNVWAYLDIAGNDGQDDPADISATTTSPNTFDYAFDFTVSPTQGTNPQGAIVNLFYIDNWLHDAWYNAGFTEATGNAQYLNYGRGGMEGDPILAEAQDFSGRNNANMFTPPDGFSPRQQMYLWTGPVESKTVDTSSASGASFVFDPAFPASFGPKDYDVTGELVIYNDGVGSGSAVFDACEPTSQDLTGKIALIADIFTCRFDLKVSNAEAAGAIGAIIVWNDGPDTDNAFHMGGDNIVSIPSLGVSDQDANPVIDAINGGDPVTMHMALATAPDRDGSVDTQVVAHEFFHYVSNRLVGNSFGLSNQQGGGMGEGWSDMASLLLSARPDDLANNPDGRYSAAGYVAGDFFVGLRAFPYSTDMTANPLTFKAITSNPEVHFVGTVWATMLWEAYVGLYKHYAAVDPATAYVTAKTKMMNYIIEGLMATPNAPTMVEARDAILAVAKATNSADYDVFVTAFAKRGMGFGAIAPPRDSTSLTGVQESYETDLKAFVVQDGVLDVNAEGVCDADYSLDPGETGEVRLTLKNIGSADLTGVTAQLHSDSNVTFANDGVVTFEPDTLEMFGGTVSATTTATVNSADQTSQPMAITVSFPDVGHGRKDVLEPGSIQFQFLSNQDFAPGEFTDDVENRFASLFDWTRMLTGDGAGWSVDSQFSAALGLPADNHYWYGPDNGSPTDIALVTPPIKVGYGPFSVSFYHYYQFESSDQNYDGGVVEITTDGGKHWTDVTRFGRFEFGYNGTIAAGNPYLGGRPGFVNFGGTVYDGAPETIRFGGRLGGKTIQLRFRVGSDAFVGEVGWIIDDVTVKGAIAPMFSVVVPEDAYCGVQNGDGAADHHGRGPH